MAVILNCTKIKKDFGEFSVLKDVNFHISQGETVGLVGLNGTGKSTLANAVFGQLNLDGGDINWYKKNIKICYLSQSGDYNMRILNGSIMQNDNFDSVDKINEISSKLGIQKLGQWDDTRLINASGGEKIKYALANIWVQRPDFMILDEPTNHLDYKGVQWLIDELKKFKGTTLIISHDRYLLDQCVNRILEIEEGSIHAYNGNYSFYRKEKKRRYESQLNEYLNQEKKRLKIDEEINRLKNWSSSAHRDSRRKAIETGNKFGGKEYNRAKAKRMDKQIKSRIIRLNKIEIEGVKKPKEERKVHFQLDNADRKGRRLIEAINISKYFRDKLLFKESSFYVQRGEKVGIFGDNGCGKSTLLKLIMNEDTLSQGQMFLSNSAKVAYFNQEELESERGKSIFQLFQFKSAEERGRIQIVLANLGFSEEALKKPLERLSLGELTRRKIALLILEKPDVIILDEPTNHLDLYSREKLEEQLEEYNGTILLVSHDRYMMDRVCDKLLVFKDYKVKRLELTLSEFLNKEAHKKASVNIKENNFGEEKLVVENELAFVLGEICKYSPDTYEYKKLDLQYKELIKRKKEIMKG
ncbi:MAG: ABC-F family ATP-binding cassette domain-containing protein [Bacillota bacterium]|nr:ABC-F family ATP-binding cassette domain-containing protein [Bacillota bacterium]